jgi:hypothetical protein
VPFLVIFIKIIIIKKQFTEFSFLKAFVEWRITWLHLYKNFNILNYNIWQWGSKEYMPFLIKAKNILSSSILWLQQLFEVRIFQSFTKVWPGNLHFVHNESTLPVNTLAYYLPYYLLSQHIVQIEHSKVIGTVKRNTVAGIVWLMINFRHILNNFSV